MAQWVILKRDQHIDIVTPTWSEEVLGRVEPSKVRWLTDKVEKLVDKFVIDYLRANQRR